LLAPFANATEDRFSRIETTSAFDANANARRAEVNAMSTGHDANSFAPDVPLPLHTSAMTADEFFQLPPIVGRMELVAGEVRTMSPAGFGHGEFMLNIGEVVRQFVRTHQLGAVSGGDIGFVLSRNPDTVRAPDLAFLRSERVPPGRRLKFIEGPPDLAVEILSPDARASEVAAKTEAWLTAGTRMVWNVDPRNNTVTIHVPSQPPRTLAVADQLDGGDVLPGFSCPVSVVFAQ
jgi:Uma2 family endonuclease